MYENRMSSADKSDQLINGHRPKPQSTSNKYKQLCLDSFGQLQRNTGQSSASSSGESEPLAGSCSSCSKLIVGPSSKCSFCENTACHGCLRCCFICSCDFCSFCSLQIYDRSEDKSVCLSCSTK